MKINTKNTRIKLIITASLFVLLTGSVATALFLNEGSEEEVVTQDKDNRSTESESITPQDSQSTPSTKPIDKEDTAASSDTPTETTVDEDGDGRDIVHMVSSVDSSRGVVYLRGGINTPDLTDGRCFAELVGPDGQALIKDTDLLPNPISTDCRTISINESELSPGQWSYVLKFESNSLKGQTNEVTFNL